MVAKTEVMNKVTAIYYRCMTSARASLAVVGVSVVGKYYYNNYFHDACEPPPCLTTKQVY